MVRKLLTVLQGTHFLIFNLSEVAKAHQMCTSFYAQFLQVKFLAFVLLVAFVEL